jgi:tetratricopeptide (TPR) repeat protein
MSKEKTPSSAETSAETSPIKLETWRDLWARFVSNRYVSIGTTVILLAVLLWIGARFYLSSQNKEALREMRYAEEYFRQDSFEKALKGSISFMGFEQLAREYRWTKAGNLCRLYQGLCHLKLGQYEAAIEALEGCDIPDTYLGGAAYGALAAAYAETKNFAKAAKTYEKAAEIHNNSQTSPMYLLYAGLSYELAGEYKNAARVYRGLLARYPLAGEAPTAQKHLARVEAYAP